MATEFSGRPIRAMIHRQALRHNYLQLKSLAPNAYVFAVVKANGYGHGLGLVTETLRFADGFALLSLDEAISLRQAGFSQPILLLEGAFTQQDVIRASENAISLVVHSLHQIAWLQSAELSAPVSVFLKFNSGMNRLGFELGRATELLSHLSALPTVRDVTLMTHFATADDERGIADQLATFNQYLGTVELPRSLCNSAALLRFPEAHSDWVRPGIALYGSSPFSGESAESLGLQPVMSLQAEIIAVQDLKPGDTVGYGATFTATTPMRIGVVACGYADGYPRHAPTGTPVLVGGVRSRLVGRVSMDMITVDLNGLDQAGVGSVVTLWGQGLSVDEVAAAAGTISYELTCAIAARVPVYSD